MWGSDMILVRGVAGEVRLMCRAARFYSEVVSGVCMSKSKHIPNVPQVEIEEITHPKLRAVIDKAVVTKSPPVAWYRTMAHNPEVGAAFAAYWELLHRGGTVPHEIKELARIQIAQMVGC